MILKKLLPPHQFAKICESGNFQYSWCFFPRSGHHINLNKAGEREREHLLLIVLYVIQYCTEILQFYILEFGNSEFVPPIQLLLMQNTIITSLLNTDLLHILQYSMDTETLSPQSAASCMDNFLEKFTLRKEVCQLPMAIYHNSPVFITLYI